MAAVVLDEAFELLDLLPERVPLILLPFGINVHVWCSDAEPGMSSREFFYVVKANKNLSLVFLVDQSVTSCHPLFSSADVLPVRLVEAAGDNTRTR